MHADVAWRFDSEHADTETELSSHDERNISQKYIQNKFLTCSREAADPILSQNIDLKYVVPKAKSEKKNATKKP